MKKITLLLPLLCTTMLNAQRVSIDEPARKVAGNVIQSTTYRFANSKTGETFESTKGHDTSVNVKAESKFNKWMYVNGVLATGMVKLSEATGDQKYAGYAAKNFDFIFNNLDYFKKQFDAGVQSVEYRPVFRMGSLHAVGAMAEGLID